MLQPQPSSDRYISIDALRGFALLGVLVTNIFLFNASPDNFSDYFDQFTDPLNQSATAIIKQLFKGRFFPIFAFLFGFGIGLQYLRHKMNPFHYTVLFRRLGILLLIGCIHYVFVWNGDILVRYAIAGCFAAFVAPLKRNYLLALSILIYAIHSIHTYYSVQTEQIQDDLPSITAIHHSYLQLVSFRLGNIVTSHLNEANILYMVKILAFIMFGLFFSKAYNFKNSHTDSRKWLNALLVLIAMRIISAFVSYEFSDEQISITLSFMNYALNPAIYVAVFILIINSKWGRLLEIPFAYVGKMSLTNYLLQTILLSYTFFNYGLGKFQVWPPYMYLILAIPIFAFQIIFSYVWLRKFTQGPVEKLWRLATYYPNSKKK